ncbi:MAG TPA: translation initiation factor IF-2, partial [Methanomassiliicoccales archaeon]|nr:translation initiation factor IF-2 [Methanomassiliicoccales archaeon]
MTNRQPIVSVLGHVDHGKTSLLDYIRGTTVSAREAGFITQHIGATEVPLEHIEKVCAQLMRGKKFGVPGLLFIDTPGHQSFISLRARGGSLADIAVLVIDINDGLKPQTIESINILRRYKTPFVIALNKIDLVDGWISNPKSPFILSERTQTEEVKDRLNNRMYEIIGRFSMEGLSADRYDRIDNFTKNIALIPVSAKTGEGIPDLLLVLIGLAQRFLEGKISTEEGPAKGTILEVKEEKGLGQTLDVIIYAGTLRRGDAVALGTKSGKPLLTKVKAVLKPKPLDEIRDPRDRFDSVKEISAAAGVKVNC